MTKKLFYENPYQRSFTASVTGCIEMENKSQWAITLNETLFYPEGGGQPADTGILGGVNVIDTHEKNGEIIHITDNPLELDSIVEGIIDWETRFSLMQHHSGEHIISGIIKRLYGYDNVGFHMGHDAVTIDVSGELSTDELRKVERIANEAVWQNLTVKAEYPSPQELAILPYRSKKELTGNVRIVTIPGCDICACCGLHVMKTGEIGLIKLINVQRYKGGVRVWLLCGDRALIDYDKKNSDIFTISALLSAKPQETVLAIERLLKERDEQKNELSDLQERFFATKAASIEKCAFTIQFEASLSPNEMRRYALALCERCEIAIVFSGNNTAWKYTIASAKTDVRPIGKTLNEHFSGKGGGKSELIQGSLTASKSELEAFLQLGE